MPTSDDSVTASAVVSSDDPARPTATVSLMGAGLGADLAFDPMVQDFGDTSIGCSLEAEILLLNGGASAVELVDLSVSGSAFALVEEPVLPATLDAGDGLSLTVAFEPTSQGDHEGTLTASTGDGGEAQAELLGSTEQPGTASESFTTSEPAVDLLFSADQSGSMDDDNRSLAATFAALITELETITTDWQIIVANDDDGCTDFGVLSSATPDYDSTFQSAIQAGGGWYTESLLTVASNALESCDPGECNQGFLRDEALLHVVLISDEPEQSSGDWSDYVSWMQAVKPDSQQLRVSAVAGDYPGGCGSAQAGTGYYEAASATEGVFLSICDDWSDTAAALARASAWAWLFELSETPDPETIAVFVNGGARADDWSWDEGRNAVVFTSTFPDADVAVRIEYTLAGACE